MTPPGPRTTVVVVTRDRREGLLQTLDRLVALPDEPPVVVVDNASTDGTADAVRERHPGVEVVALTANLGAAGRNVGVARAATPYVAFADDDSWWEPAALARAAAILDAHPDVALVAARILVGPEERLDPVSALMADGPLGRRPGLPGPAVLGFLACGAVVRRDAFLAVGGFDDLLHFLGEEDVVAWDLAAAGHHLVYADDVVAHHHPSSPSDPAAREVRQIRNALLSAGMRRPVPVVVRAFAAAARRGLADDAARRGVREALALLPAAVRRRRRLPAAVEQELRRLAAAAAR